VSKRRRKKRSRQGPKLHYTDAVQIRIALFVLREPVVHIAAAFGVRPCHVSNIKADRRWSARLYEE
jgi:hypothetical protein